VDVNLDELWAVIPGHPEYAASTHGNIRRVVLTHPKSSDRPLKPGVGSSGYFQVLLYGKDGRKTCAVHQLVASTFLGPCPEGMQVGHLDNSRQNNRIENLVYCTSQQNHDHRMKCGNALRGTDNPRAKLSDMAVRVIRRSPGLSGKELASMFGVTPGAIYALRDGRTWNATGRGVKAI
jgi:hypothetical protein